MNAVLIGLTVLSALVMIFLVLLHSTVVERNLDRLTVITAVIFAFVTVILAIRLQPA